MELKIYQRTVISILTRYLLMLTEKQNIHIPKIKNVTPKRQEAITKLIRAGFTIEDLKNIFEKAEQSSFLRGENKNNWNATFDWLIKEENAVKVIEGNYTDKPKKNTQKSSNPFVALALEMEN